MKKENFIPLLASIIAVVVTAVMDFSGYVMFSALSLIVINAVFWFIQRQTKAEFGLKMGYLKHYGLTLSYPFIVLGLTTLIAYFYGDFSIDMSNGKTTMINLVAGLIMGPLVLILTEEGFFRGWLWGSLKKAGHSDFKILILTSIVFVVWHISAVVSDSDYGLPLTQVPIYLINAFLLSMIWGAMRLVSGSVVVPAVCHAVWNAFAYGLFGFGEKIGFLGVSNTFLLGPEVGYLGIVLNGLFFMWLWKYVKNSRKRVAAETVYNK